ncbi:MAG: cob(I)yrinic acid a,c-diamide adenosyltransferase [Deltaproteobacteria bacterium]|nr:cob(I)yrinic acid a,c-diamide adenosyltransferase [Deltaproteobacteria bacterium]
MAKIYTKTGDLGETGLFGGSRVKKSHPRIVAYGTVDELNAVLGQVRSKNDDPSLHKFLERVQSDLFHIGALLATPDREKITRRGVSCLGEKEVRFLEETIDHYDRELSPLTNFILPGGTEIAAGFHIARTVCRRAEREVVSLMEREEIDPSILVYLNRLSDLFFVLARWVNMKKRVADSPWEKR